MEKTNFEKLEVYQVAVKIADITWDIVVGWKHFEKTTLGRQLVTSADSIGVNIAEGCGRRTHQYNKRFIRIAGGSLNETRHWSKLTYRRRQISVGEIDKLNPLIDEPAPGLNAYLSSIDKHKFDAR